jgi:cytochrome P450
MPTIDLSGPAFRSAPYPIYRMLRDHEPAHRLPLPGGEDGIWLISRYRDVDALLRDARLSKDLARVVPPERLSPLDFTMLGKDPPDHSRLRALVSQAFTPRRVAELEPRIAATAGRLLAGLRERGGGDFIAEFATPLPVLVIAEMLGVPVEDEALFRRWSGDFMSSVDAARAGEESRRLQREALRGLTGYFEGLIRARRARRGDDLLSALIDARDAGGRLSEEELVGSCVLLLITGHETTTHLLGNGLYTLLRHPGERALLRDRPELLPLAVEEILRFESPVQRTSIRIAVEEVELAGRRIQPGERVSGSAGGERPEAAE